MTPYQILQQELRAEPRMWLITGVGGFIGSHLLETLLELGQRVVGLDNFSTGTPRNLHDVQHRVGGEAWARFTFQKGSVADIGACREASNQVDYVLHHAGFVSVPLSIEDPVGCHDTNVTGSLNVLVAARDNRVRRVVYASSSAVYGDDPAQPNVETQIGHPLSPYGASKLMGEIYAQQFHQHYRLESIGLRYFNIFGPRQNPTCGYAAVIPHWISTLLRGLNSVNLATLAAERNDYERSDICAVPAASVVVEHVVAFELARAMCEKVAGDTLREMWAAYEFYLDAVRQMSGESQ